MTTLWYRRPAETWTDALPVGNGRIGGMVFGGVASERIALNDDTLWSGGPADTTNPGGPRTLAEVRAHLAAGEYAQADEASKRMMGPYTQSYLALGDLRLEFSGLGDPNAVTDYRRSLDLATGIARTEFSANGTRYVREIFCSNPDQPLVIRMTADGPGRIDFEAKLDSQLPCETNVHWNGLMLRGKAPALVDPTYYRRARSCISPTAKGCGSSLKCGPLRRTAPFCRARKNSIPLTRPPLPWSSRRPPVSTAAAHRPHAPAGQSSRSPGHRWTWPCANRGTRCVARTSPIMPGCSTACPSHWASRTRRAPPRNC